MVRKKPQKKATETKKTPPPMSVGVFKASVVVYRQLQDMRLVVFRLLSISVVAVLVVAGPTLYLNYTEAAVSINDLTTVAATGFTAFVIELATILLSIIGGTAISSLSVVEQLWILFVSFLLWVTTLWLIRARAQKQSNLYIREGLYTASAPLIPTLLVSAWGLLQLLPLALMVGAFSVLSTAGGLDNTLVRFAALGAVVLAFAYTLYWFVGTVVALLIVTIPGTYPWFALQSAKRLISGYRLRLVKRLLWLAGLNIVALILLLAPVISLDIVTGHRLGVVVTIYTVLLYLTMFIYDVMYIYHEYKGIVDERSN